MKNFLFLLFYLCTTLLPAQTSIFGKITDGDTGEELIAANVTMFQNGVFITGIATDFNGNYSINLNPGTYNVEVSYLGYSSNRINGVIVRAGQSNKLDVVLGAGGAIDLDEIVVTDYKVPLVEHDNTTQGSSIITSGSVRKLRSKSISSISCVTAGTSAVRAEKIRTISPKEMASGQLTAGEWKDLGNWSFWEKLMKNHHFAKYKKYWGYSPDQRFSVKLSDEQGRALANVRVNLLNQSKEKIWEARTDNKGSAELWANFFEGEDTDFKIQIQQNNSEYLFEAMPYAEGLNSLRLPLDCNANNKIDIAFVVDATGSMLDEIAYLNAEIRDVIQRAEEENQVQLRCGAVFYSDTHYVDPVYSTGLSEKHEQTISFMKNLKNKNGGGEWAEAVDLGLAGAIRGMEWDEEAISRIVFLILDASPHYKESVLKDIQQSIREAAAMGIKIIPVAASGIKKETEFLLKFFAMATNGTYTFLTDHSGIGNAHIKPEAGEYNVETLNDLLVRLIGENSEYHDCEPVITSLEKRVQQKRLSRKERRKKEIKTFSKQIKCLPNPASDHIFVTLEEAVDLLVVTTSDSKIVQQFSKVKSGQIKINTSKWASGLYFLHFYLDTKHIVEKIVVNLD